MSSNLPSKELHALLLASLGATEEDRQDTYRELCGRLQAGEVITVSFPSEEDKVRFAGGLRTAKVRADRLCLGIGFMEEKDKQALNFKRVGARETFTYRISLAEKKQPVRFTLLSEGGE